MDLGNDSRPALRTVEIVPPSARAEAWNVLRVAALVVLGTWIYLADAAAPGAGVDAGAVGGGGTAGEGATGGGARERDLMPYQRRFGSLGSEDQRMFRELQEGLLEAENARWATGRWPAPEVLAAQGVPPFAGSAGTGAAGNGATGSEAAGSGTAGTGLGGPGASDTGVTGTKTTGTGAAGDQAAGAPGVAAMAIPPSRAGGSRRRLYRWQLLQDGLVVNYLGLPAGASDPAFLLLVQEPDPQAPPALAAAQAVDEMHHRLPDGTLLHVLTWMRAATLRGPAGGVVGAGGGAAGVIAEPFARGWTQLLAGAGRR